MTDQQAYDAIKFGTLANIDMMLSAWFCDNNGCGCAGCPFRDKGFKRDCPRHQVREALKKMETTDHQDNQEKEDTQ